jgi:hypothetical protein
MFSYRGFFNGCYNLRDFAPMKRGNDEKEIRRARMRTHRNKAQKRKRG